MAVECELIELPNYAKSKAELQNLRNCRIKKDEGKSLIQGQRGENKSQTKIHHQRVRVEMETWEGVNGGK